MKAGHELHLDTYCNLELINLSPWLIGKDLDTREHKSMAASTSSWFFRDEEEEDEEEPNNKLQSLLDQSDVSIERNDVNVVTDSRLIPSFQSTILKCLRRKAREDKNFLFWNFSPSDDVEEDDVYEPVNESQTAPNRASALVQVTLYANGRLITQLFMLITKMDHRLFYKATCSE